MPEIDESRILVKDLAKILPDEVIPEIAKNLFKDIMLSSPPFFLAGGEELYTHGNVVFFTSDQSFSLQITVPVNVGRGTVQQQIGWSLTPEIEETIEEMGLNKEEITEQIGLFILSNINGQAMLHEYAIGLFEEIGTDSFSAGHGTLDNEELFLYVDNTINEVLRRTQDIQKKFYWQGIQKHIQALFRSGDVKSTKSAIEIFNEALPKQEITYYVDSNYDFDDQVVQEVFNYIINPLSYFQENPEIVINLVAYEQQYGKLPKQLGLPGME